jgi:gamma-glutamyl hydrolase
VKTGLYLRYIPILLQYHLNFITEWNPDEDINHSPEAIQVMEYFAEFIVNEARKSQHAFPSPAEETAALIYNYNPVYTENVEPDFEQIYAF